MNLKEVYEAMGGDYDSVMTRLPREASVIKFLKKFVEAEDYSKMIEAADNKDYETLFAVSHTVKGVCANLSITALSNSSSALCESVRGGAPTIDIAPLVEECKKDYAVTVDAISKLEE